MLQLFAASVTSDYKMRRVTLQLVDIGVVGAAYPDAVCIVQNGVGAHVRMCEHRRWGLGAADFRDQSYPGSALRDARPVRVGRGWSWIIAVVRDHVILD